MVHCTPRCDPDQNIMKSVRDELEEIEGFKKPTSTEGLDFTDADSTQTQTPLKSPAAVQRSHDCVCLKTLPYKTMISVHV